MAPTQLSLPAHDDLVRETREILDRLGVGDLSDSGELVARSPITGGELARVPAHTVEDVRAIVGSAQDAFRAWRTVPGPVRGQLVRELGELLRQHKADLGALVSIEAGKIRSEGLGEVQEMIDICDLAVGLSRQLFGLTIASERPGHRMMEQWHPLGCRGRDQRVQLPRGGVVVECGARLRVRRPGGVEAVGEDAAHRTRLPVAGRRGRAPRRRPREHLAARARRRRGRRGARRRRSHRIAVGHRLDPHGQGRRAARRRAVRPPPARARRQQRRDRDSERRSRPHRARHRVLRRRHRGTAVHEPAPGDRPRLDRRRAGRAHQVGLRDAADRIAAQRRDVGRPADRQGRLRGLRGGAGEGPGQRRRADCGRRAGALRRHRRRLLRAARPRPHADAERDRACRDVRPDPLRDDLSLRLDPLQRTTSTRPWPCTTRCRRDCPRRSSP